MSLTIRKGLTYTDAGGDLVIILSDDFNVYSGYVKRASAVRTYNGCGRITPCRIIPCPNLVSMHIPDDVYVLNTGEPVVVVNRKVADAIDGRFDNFGNLSDGRYIVSVYEVDVSKSYIRKGDSRLYRVYEIVTRHDANENTTTVSYELYAMEGCDSITVSKAEFINSMTESDLHAVENRQFEFAGSSYIMIGGKLYKILGTTNNGISVVQVSGNKIFGVEVVAEPELAS